MSNSNPIDSHIFLSDQRTVALVDPDGVVNWLCCPRMDGAPLFGSIVGGPDAGYFRISAGGQGRQDYLQHSLIARTAFSSITLTDFLDCSAGRMYQRAGRSDLVRIIEGSGEIEVEFAPKFNFGRIPTRLSGIESGLRIDCGQAPIVLRSPGWEWQISRRGMHDVAVCKRVLKSESLSLRLMLGTGSTATSQYSDTQMLADTSQAWSGWLSTLKPPTTARDQVLMSALALRGLTYGPTGAIAAAATTSLPETIGGARNWDYRFCWPRDACLATSALLRIGAPGPAIRLLDWLLGIVLDAEDESFLAPLYTVTGRTVLGEAEVPEALGYRGSKPVRIGNLAASQLQLDTLGPIAELMLNLAKAGAALTSEHVQLAEKLAALVQSRWMDPDSGIWEVRGPQRHFVHSKLMCWHTLVCCEQVSRYLGKERADWLALAQEIRSDIETKGFDTKLNSYISAYDLPHADAALLWIVLSGFHPPQHPRSRGTVRFIMDNLVHNGAVYRYHFDDALRGQEGEFIICRTWLIEALVMTGDAGRAGAMFDEMLSRISNLKLLAEQWDPLEKCALGNYPQAYSHLGLINAACALESPINTGINTGTPTLSLISP